jgi:hypothetical protein
MSLSVWKNPLFLKAIKRNVTDRRRLIKRPRPSSVVSGQTDNQLISIQVKRRPAFIDYVRVIAPVISGVATSILIIERLR